MLQAPKPIFELLYAFIRENFLVQEMSSDGMLAGEKTLFYRNESERPIYVPLNHRLDPDDEDFVQSERFLNQFHRGSPLSGVGKGTPAGWMEFGQVTDAEFDRAPEGYSYELSYLVALVVNNERAVTGSSKHVYAPPEQALGTPGESLGIGDLVTKIVQKAWDHLHVGLLSFGNYQIKKGDIVPNYDLSQGNSNLGPGQLPLNQSNWWVKNWTFNVNGEIADTLSEWRDVIHNTPYRDATINFKFTVFEQEPLVNC